MELIKSYKYTFIGILLALLLSISFVIFIEMRKLTPFDIEGVIQTTDKKENLSMLKWSSSKNAVKYRVAVLNEDLEVLSSKTTENTELSLDGLDVETRENIIIDVMAYDIEGNKIEADTKHYKAEWTNPTISKEELKDGILNNKDLKVKILYKNNVVLNDYYLILKKDNRDLYKAPLNENYAIIPKNVLSLLYGDYELILCKDVDDTRVVIDSTKLKIYLPQISDIEMVYPKDNSSILWDDFDITFEGGEHATNYYLSLIDENGNIIIDDEEILNKKKSIKIDTLEENKNYTLSIRAFNKLDKKIEKIKSINFKTESKRTTEKVESSVQNGEIRKGDSIVLSSKTSDADIYYTLDGSIPTINSNKYNEPIKIDKDITIKAIAVRKNMYDSEISEFSYWVYDKSNSVYISPSNQYDNLGVSSVGYSNEMEMMNKVADYTEEYLNSHKIKVYRNNPNMTLEEIARDSSKKEISMHVAIHSNASAYNKKGSQTGIETWYFDNTCITQKKIAQTLQNSVMEIYYNKNRNRGIKDSSTIGGFYEISPKSVTNGVLIEVGFHDNREDATWIVNNLQTIGEAIGKGIVNYLGK